MMLKLYHTIWALPQFILWHGSLFIRCHVANYINYFDPCHNWLLNFYTWLAAAIGFCYCKVIVVIGRAITRRIHLTRNLQRRGSLLPVSNIATIHNFRHSQIHPTPRKLNPTPTQSTTQFWLYQKSNTTKTTTNPTKSSTLPWVTNQTFHYETLCRPRPTPRPNQWRPPKLLKPLAPRMPNLQTAHDPGQAAQRLDNPSRIRQPMPR